MTGWLVLAVVFVTLGILGIGLFAVAMIVVASVRARKEWAGESQVRTAEHAGVLEDPAAGGSTEGTEENTTDAWVVGQVESRTSRNITSPYGSGPL